MTAVAAYLTGHGKYLLKLYRPRAGAAAVSAAFSRRSCTSLRARLLNAGYRVYEKIETRRKPPSAWPGIDPRLSGLISAQSHDVIPERRAPRLIGDPSLSMCRLRYGFPAIAKAISGMALETSANIENRKAIGFDPAIQVEPGHDGRGRFGFFRTLVRGNDADVCRPFWLLVSRA